MKLSQPALPTLYHTQFWSSSRPLAVLEELGLTKEAGGPIDVITITEKELKSDPWLVANNPQKRLPFFYDPYNDLKLNESGGLVQYLLETYDTQNKLWPAINDPTRPEFLKLLHFGPASAYHVGVPILFRYGVAEDSPLRTSEENYRAKINDFHNFVAPTLQQALGRHGGPFLLGDKFSAADIVCGYDLMTISFTKCAKELLEPFPQVKDYLDRISQRSVYQKLYTMPASGGAATTSSSKKTKTAAASIVSAPVTKKIKLSH
mmetsp:Transcript_8099/g.17111  ORF Transcript_8099/g.17111 Transcript_8099/m.17111 type:complete len:262 (+) Transcript_8099:987-1772(+)